MRPQSEIGFLMLQWLGVLVPGAFREEVQTWGGSRAAGKTEAIQGTPAGFIDTTASHTLTWPSVEAMLSGEPPEGYDQTLLRAAVEGNGSAVTHVDPEAWTFTVSTTPPLAAGTYHVSADGVARFKGDLPVSSIPDRSKKPRVSPPE